MATELIEDTSDSTVVMAHGIPYSFDDLRTGHWTPWNVLMFIDGVSATYLNQSKFLHTKDLMTEGSFMVRVKHIIHINPKIYDFNYKDQINFRLTKKIHKVGSSSVTLRAELEDLTTKTLLVNRYYKIVRSNPLRKPLPHPVWFLDKYKAYKDTQVPAKLEQKSKIPQAPDDCCSMLAIIRQSDLDWNQHTNVAVYTKLCLDCAMTAVSQNKLVGFHGDINCYPVVCMESDYIGESFAGDELVVKCWQDPNDRFSLKFLVVKLDSPIHFSVMKFKDEKSKL